MYRSCTKTITQIQEAAKAISKERNDYGFCLHPFTSPQKASWSAKQAKQATHVTQIDQPIHLTQKSCLTIDSPDLHMLLQASHYRSRFIASATVYYMLNHTLLLILVILFYHMYQMISENFLQLCLTLHTMDDTADASILPIQVDPLRVPYSLFSTPSYQKVRQQHQMISKK